MVIVLDMYIWFAHFSMSQFVRYCKFSKNKVMFMPCCSLYLKQTISSSYRRDFMRVIFLLSAFNMLKPCNLIMRLSAG